MKVGGLYVDGYIDKYKAHLFVKGFTKVEIINYSMTFSLITKMNYIQFILLLVASWDWSVYQMDVKSVFLYRNLHEEIHMKDP